MKLFQRRSNTDSSNDLCYASPIKSKLFPLSPRKKKGPPPSHLLDLTDEASSCAGSDWLQSSTHSTMPTSPVKRSRSSLPCFRRVQFDDMDIVYHDSPWVLVHQNTSAIGGLDQKEKQQPSLEASTSSESSSSCCDLEDESQLVLSEQHLWYQKADLVKMRADAAAHANLVEQSASDKDAPHTAWMESLSSAHQLIQSATAADQVSAIVKGAKRSVTVHPHCVGLEKWMHNGPSTRNRQRKDLLAAVLEAQAKGASPKALRALCRDASRCSRLWAIYLGRNVTSSGAEEDSEETDLA